MRLITFTTFACLVVICWLASSAHGRTRGDEFYASCDADEVHDSVQKAGRDSSQPLDYACLTVAPDQVDMVIGLKRSPQSAPLLPMGAQAMTFTELMARSWAKSKDLLLLASELSVVENARRCYRLKAAGFKNVKILLGGVRAYLAGTHQPVPQEITYIEPAEIQGMLARGRVRIVDLDGYRSDQGVFDHAEATSDLWQLAPSADAEQYMPVLAVGSDDEYRLLQQQGLPHWAYLLQGGEDAYQRYAARLTEVHRMRNTKLRKCALR